VFDSGRECTTGLLGVGTGVPVGVRSEWTAPLDANLRRIGLRCLDSRANQHLSESRSRAADAAQRGNCRDESMYHVSKYPSIASTGEPRWPMTS
jgi:hypothetical protein